jgi:hypothetical protein
MTDWESDALWQKAKLYAGRAQTEQQEGPLFAFWSILALELLARTVVANVHPALLADPQNLDNLLYAFGLGQLRQPRSVQAKAVFSRCVKIVPDFTESDRDIALGLVELRNAELHSGATPFEGLKTAVWLAGYYRICQLLLRSLGRELDALFGPEQAVAAEKMVVAAAEELQSEVRDYISAKRKAFDADPRQDERRKSGAVELATLEDRGWAPHLMGSAVDCPACASRAWITGEFVRSGDPVAEEDAIVREIVKIPTRLQCFVCDLEIVGHARLHAIGLGGLYSGELREDPASFFQIEFDPTDYYEPDYGNE